MSTHARSRANNRSRCPQCGARNPAAAEWCGQCLARFEPVHETEPVHQTQPVNEAEPVHETEPVHERETTSLPAAAAARQDDAASGMQAGAERAGAPPETFVVADGLVSWRCGLCDSVNPLEAAACGVCGASFAATVAPRAPAPHRDARTAAALSLLWPGVGHAYLGDWGQALARAVAGAWVTFVALLLSVSAGSGAPAALLFSVAALALTLVAAHDAYRAAAGRPQEAILSGRALTWVFVALMCLSLVAVVASGLSALA